MTSPLTAQEQTEPPGKPQERQCAWCGESFKTRRVEGAMAQRFCSKSHRVMYAQWRKKQAESA